METLIPGEKRVRTLLGALILSAGLLTGCLDSAQPQEEFVPGRALQAFQAENGGNLNGGNLNGGNLNGNDLSQFLIHVNYAGVKRWGTRLDEVWLHRTQFRGFEDDDFYQGEDFVGAEFVGNRGNGDTVRLRINGMTSAPAPNDDLYLYSVSFLGSDGRWHPACRDYTNTPVLAMPLDGAWDFRQGVPGGGSKLDDPEHFTFACMGGALAKCVLFGYRPWATFQGGSLASYHQACTRLVRADYCGDGASHTQNGNLINLYDELGIQQDTEDWVFEAEWDEGGARCFYPLNRSRAGIPCYDSRLDYACGLDFPSPRLGALFRNETPDAGLPLPLPLP